MRGREVYYTFISMRSTTSPTLINPNHEDSICVHEVEHPGPGSQHPKPLPAGSRLFTRFFTFKIDSLGQKSKGVSEMNQEIKTTTAPSIAGSEEDDWETVSTTGL
jgi:hypothetical protein